MNEDLINRYIDGELNKEEKDKFEKQADSSPELKNKLEAMKNIHNILLTQKEKSPSKDFTSLVMRKISRSSSFHKSQNYFFTAIVSVFSLICLGILGYLVGAVLSSTGDSSLSLPDISVPIINYIGNFTERTEVLINPKYFSVIGYLAASLVLLSGYIFFENLKSLKKVK
jgi:hypothetical protein